MPPIDPQVAEAIRFRKSQYCRWADSGDWAKFDGLMVPDFVFRTINKDGTDFYLFDIKYTWESREAWVAYFKAAFADQQVMHMTGPGEIEQTGPDEVKAVFGVLYNAGSKGPSGGVHVNGGGHYHETWVKRGEEWWMKDVTMQNMYYKIIPVPEA